MKTGDRGKVKPPPIPKKSLQQHRYSSPRKPASPWEVFLRGELPAGPLVSPVFSPLLLPEGEPHVKVILYLGHRLADVGQAAGSSREVGGSHQLDCIQRLLRRCRGRG